MITSSGKKLYSSHAVTLTTGPAQMRCLCFATLFLLLAVAHSPLVTAQNVTSMLERAQPTCQKLYY